MIRLRQPNQPDLKRDNSRVQFTRTRPRDCPGITARIPLIGSSGQLVELDDVQTDYFVTSIHYDPADYPGAVQVYYQTWLQTFAGFPDYTYRIVDENGTVYDSHTVPNTLATPTMQPLRAFTPDVVAHDYMIRMLAVPGAVGELVIRRWMMWVDVVDSARVVLPIPMMFYNFGSGGLQGSPADNNYFAYAGAVNNQPAYGRFSAEATLFLLERLKNLGASVRYELEVIAALDLHGGAATTGGMILNSKTSGLNVPASEILITSETPARYTVSWSPGSAVNFTDLEDFQFLVKVGGAPNQEILVYKQQLNAIINCPSQMQLHHNVQNDCQSTATGVPRIRYETSARMGPIDSTKYEPGVIWYFDATGSVGVVDRVNGTNRLFDTGVADSGIAGALIAGSTLAAYVNVPDYNRIRTGNLVLVDGNNVMHVHDDGNNVGQPLVVATGVSYLIAEVVRP